jgi:hypothetical protein
MSPRHPAPVSLVVDLLDRLAVARDVVGSYELLEALVESWSDEGELDARRLAAMLRTLNEALQAALDGIQADTLNLRKVVRC